MMMKVLYFVASSLVLTLGDLSLLWAITVRVPSGRTSAALTSLVSWRAPIANPGWEGTVLRPVASGWTVASTGERSTLRLTRLTRERTAAASKFTRDGTLALTVPPVMPRKMRLTTLPLRLLAIASSTMPLTSAVRCARAAESVNLRCPYLTMSGSLSGAASLSCSTLRASLALIPPMSMPPAVTPLATVSLRDESYAHAPTAPARSRPTTTATITNERCFICCEATGTVRPANGIVAEGAVGGKPNAYLQAGLRGRGYPPVRGGTLWPFGP